MYIDWSTVITLAIVAAVLFVMMRCGIGCGGCGMGSRRKSKDEQSGSEHDHPSAAA